MHRALWLLIGLQLRGWLRFAMRNFASVRGVLFFLVGLGLFSIWIMSLFFTPTGSSRLTPEKLERLGPVFILGACLINLFMSSGNAALPFGPRRSDVYFRARSCGGNSCCMKSRAS